MREPTTDELLELEELHELHYLESLFDGPDSGQSILEFVPRISPTFVVPQHLKPLADLLFRAEQGNVRALISVPPRHSKTELLIHFMVWYLSRHPEAMLAYVSYSGDLASEKSSRARALALAGAIKMDPRTQRGDKWRTAYGGGLNAVGIGGSLTGKGANLLIVDDPIKNREEAESKTIRNKNFEWFTSTAMSRLEPNGSAIVVHTRWHEDDLIGRLLTEQPGRWEYINLPAVKEDGSALWTQRWPRKVLDIRKEDVGPYDWASLYLGQPRPRGGRLFDRDPVYYDFPNTEHAAVLIACDPAATAKTWADHSAIVVGAAMLDPQTRLPRIDILEVQRLQVEIPLLVEYLRRTQVRWGAPVVIEAVGGFKAVPQALRLVCRDVRIIEIHPTADKFTRALPAAAAWNSGRIRVPARETGKPWVRDFVSEIQSFTGVGDAHDDQVDGLAHLVNSFSEFLLRSPARVVSMPPGTVS